jgi:hypothetical protein
VWPFGADFGLATFKMERGVAKRLFWVETSRQGEVDQFDGVHLLSVFGFGELFLSFFRNRNWDFYKLFFGGDFGRENFVELRILCGGKWKFLECFSKNFVRKLETKKCGDF